MRLRTGNPDRLQSVFFIKRLGEAGAVRGRPVDSLIGELHGLRFKDCGTAGRAHRGGADRSGRRRPCAVGSDDGERERQARRDMPVHPGKQSFRLRSYSWRGRKDLRIGSGFLVDDGEPGVDRGAVLGIGGAIDSGGEDDTAVSLKPDESVAPGRIVRREVWTGDGDETAALAEPRQSGSDMAQRRVRHAPIDIRHRREGRVHHDDARRGRGIQMIVDLRRVEAGYDDAREEVAEQRRARLRQLVQHERTAGDLGEDGE